jgi:hypothetical protein
LRADLRLITDTEISLPYLNCTRCRLSIEQHSGRPAFQHCPRCLSALGERVPLFRSPLPLELLDVTLEESR